MSGKREGPEEVLRKIEFRHHARQGTEEVKRLTAALPFLLGAAEGAVEMLWRAAEEEAGMHRDDIKWMLDQKKGDES